MSASPPGGGLRARRLMKRSGTAALLTVALACSAGQTDGTGNGGQGGTGAGPGAGAGGSGFGGEGFGGGVGGAPPSGVPQTCAEAVEQQSYIGCEYWPTVTSNSGLYNGFEFAIA